MNLCLFFEGTGRGVAGKVTNVARLCDLCVDNARHFRRTFPLGCIVVEEAVGVGESEM